MVFPLTPAKRRKSRSVMCILHHQQAFARGFCKHALRTKHSQPGDFKGLHCCTSHSHGTPQTTPQLLVLTYYSVLQQAFWFWGPGPFRHSTPVKLALGRPLLALALGFRLGFPGCWLGVSHAGGPSALVRQKTNKKMPPLLMSCFVGFCNINA